MKLNINTSKSQTMTCDEIESFVKAHLGLRTTLDEPEGGYPPTFPLTQDTHLPTTIQPTGGIYTDTKQKLEAKGITVNLGQGAKEYVRVLDEEVLRVYLANITHAEDDRISVAELASITNNLIFKNNTTIVDLSSWAESGVTALTQGVLGGAGVNSGSGAPSLKVLAIPNKVTVIKSNGDVRAGFQTFNCPNIEVLYLNNVKNITSYEGPYWTKLTKIHIKDEATFLGITYGQVASVPMYCGKATLYKNGVALTALTIPKTITQINAYALYNLQTITAINYEGTVEEYKEISKGTDWHYNVPCTQVTCSDGVCDIDATS